jgi:hypothetical protein
VLKDEKKASTILSAINVNVTQVYSTRAGFVTDVGSEALRKRGLAGSHVSYYHNSLGHSSWGLQGETKEFSKQT